MKTLIKFTIFAIIATSLNIISQDVFLRLYFGSFDLYLSILIGTIVGLVVKYYLDKKYIFEYITTSTATDWNTFILYAATGVFTTAIFWGFELTFHFAFKTDAWRYFGGIIGLAIGYWIKFILDKNLVFVKK